MFNQWIFRWEIRYLEMMQKKNKKKEFQYARVCFCDKRKDWCVCWIVNKFFEKEEEERAQNKINERKNSTHAYNNDDKKKPTKKNFL
jgi:hypothetical protein